MSKLEIYYNEEGKWLGKVKNGNFYMLLTNGRYWCANSLSYLKGKDERTKR